MLYVSESVGAEVVLMILFAVNVLLHRSLKVSFMSLQEHTKGEHFFFNEIKWGF